MRRCCAARRKSGVQRTQKRGVRREGPPGGLNLGVPWGDESVVEEYEDEIDGLADTLWSRMKDGFSGSSFQMTALQPLVDDVDVLMGELYDLTDEQVSFTQNYLTDPGGGSARAGGGDEDLTHNPIVAETN